jgi:hypothetical protein
MLMSLTAVSWALVSFKCACDLAILASCSIISIDAASSQFWDRVWYRSAPVGQIGRSEDTGDRDRAYRLHTVGSAQCAGFSTKVRLRYALLSVSAQGCIHSLQVP